MAKQSSDSVTTSGGTEVASGSTRRSPSTIRHMVESKDVETLQGEMVSKYGFRLNDAFAAELIAYVGKKHTSPPALVASKDAATVRAEYRSLYGGEITNEYANDLIAFFGQLEKGE